MKWLKMGLKDYTIIGFLVVGLLAAMFYSKQIRDRDNEILDLRVAAQNLAVELGQIRTERDSSLTALTRISSLNTTLNRDRVELGRRIDNLQTVLLRSEIMIGALRDSIYVLSSSPAEEDTTRRVFSVRSGHLYADGWFQTVPPYPILVTLGQDPIKVETTLFVTDQKQLAMNYRLYSSGPVMSHIFTDVDESLFRALFDPHTPGPISQVSLLRRVLSEVELGIGGGYIGSGIVGTVQAKYKAVGVGLYGAASGTDRVSTGVMATYFFRPFR